MEQEQQHHRSLMAWGEVILIFLLFFVLAGAVPPDVNEVHYLAKAKHYWDPEWCSGDFFLASSDAHLVFYWTFGWLTQFLSLPAVAWIGRLATWLLLAWSWRRLSEAIVPGRLVALLTAGLLACLLQWGHMAGEWLIGGVEAKGFAYVLVFLGLEALVRGRWRATWLLLGAASSFHVLVGGWSVVAGLIAWRLSKDRPALASMLPALFGGLILALPGLLPAVMLTRGADPAVVTLANEIYVFGRLDHHLVFHRLALPHILRHVALLACWLFALRSLAPGAASKRLHAFVAGAVLIGLAGVVIDLCFVFLRPVASSLLRYYWFRLPDAMLPLGVTMACVQLIQQRWPRNRAWGTRSLVIAIALASVNVAHASWWHWLDRRPRAVAQANPLPKYGRDVALDRFRAWQEMCAWIAVYTPPDATILTPRYQQTFKWYAERGEVATWKDVPQDANALVEWYRRMLRLYPRELDEEGLAGLGEERLKLFAREYGFQYIVVDRRRSRRSLVLPRVFPPVGTRRPFYEVYRLPRGDSTVTPASNEGG